MTNGSCSMPLRRTLLHPLATILTGFEGCLTTTLANLEQLLSLGILYKTVMGGILMIAINHKWYPQHGDSKDQVIRNTLIDKYHIDMNDPADVAKLEKLTGIVSELVDDVSKSG